MKLTKEIKDLIRQEYNTFKAKMYAGKSKEERDKLAQFFTPPEISIKLIEELTDLTGNVLDPTCGSGNLLAAAIIAGADPDKVFGNDYDLTMVNLCRERLNNLCAWLNTVEGYNRHFTEISAGKYINDWQIHRGNALHKFALLEFSEKYYAYYYDDKFNTADLSAYTDPEWLKLPDAKKRSVRGWRTKHINDSSYNAYLGKAYKADHKDVVESEEDALRKANNIDGLNADATAANEASMANSAETIAEFADSVDTVQLF